MKPSLPRPSASLSLKCDWNTNPFLERMCLHSFPANRFIISFFSIPYVCVNILFVFLFLTYLVKIFLIYLNQKNIFKNVSGKKRHTMNTVTDRVDFNAKQPKSKYRTQHFTARILNYNIRQSI